MLRSKTGLQGGCWLSGALKHLWTVAVELLLTFPAASTCMAADTWQWYPSQLCQLGHAQNKCGPNAGSEEGCLLMNVYFSAQVMPLWNQFAVHIRKKFSTQIHRTHLWPFPVSSVLNRFLKLIAEKKLSVLASWQIRLLKDVQTHNVFPCHRALFTFVYILPPWFHPS